jgi:hypothetical protein
VILQVREQEAGIMFLRPTTRPKENSFPIYIRKDFTSLSRIHGSH